MTRETRYDAQIASAIEERRMRGGVVSPWHIATHSPAYIDGNPSVKTVSDYFQVHHITTDEKDIVKMAVSDLVNRRLQTPTPEIVQREIERTFQFSLDTGRIASILKGL